MKLIFCKKMGEILANPIETTPNFVAFNDEEIANHVKNCPECKKSLKKYYEIQSEKMPFTIRIFADKLISKFIGD